MKQMHYLNTTSMRMTKTALEHIGMTLDIGQCGYTISSISGTIYGSVKDEMPSSIYPGRCEGQWLDMLKKIDLTMHIEAVDDSFIDYYFHTAYDMSYDEAEYLWLNNVKETRASLGLQ